MDKVGRETRFLTDEDEERVENGGVNSKKWSWEREEFKKQVSSSSLEGRIGSSRSKSGPTQEREDGKQVSGITLVDKTHFFMFLWPCMEDLCWTIRISIRES
jgi:hypothetical protein